MPNILQRFLFRFEIWNSSILEKMGFPNLQTYVAQAKSMSKMWMIIAFCSVSLHRAGLRLQCAETAAKKVILRYFH